MIRILPIALLAALVASPASAEDAADQDVRCLIASNTFAKVEKDPTRQKMAVESLVFYLGRLDGRVSPAQLKARLPAQGKQLTPAALGPIMDNCAKRLAQSQITLERIGKELTAQKAK